MSFSVEELQQRRSKISITLAEAEERYRSLLGSKSIAEVTAGTDVLSLREQIREIDSLLLSVPFQEDYPVPRREEFPESPTVLVDGIPPRDGIPADAIIVRKSDGSFYYVDAQGKVISRV